MKQIAAYQWNSKCCNLVCLRRSAIQIPGFDPLLRPLPLAWETKSRRPYSLLEAAAIQCCLLHLHERKALATLERPPPFVVQGHRRRSPHEAAATICMWEATVVGCVMPLREAACQRNIGGSLPRVYQR